MSGTVVVATVVIPPLPPDVVAVGDVDPTPGPTGSVPVLTAVVAPGSETICVVTAVVGAGGTRTPDAVVVELLVEVNASDRSVVVVDEVELVVSPQPLLAQPPHV